jgi:hypothetical protein
MAPPRGAAIGPDPRCGGAAVGLGGRGPRRDTMSDPVSIARTRIAEEAERRTGSLDLSDLGLEVLPEELFDLRHLRGLDLGSSRPHDPAAPRHRLDAQRERLGALTWIEMLSVAGSDLATLDPILSHGSSPMSEAGHRPARRNPRRTT